jgi:hypothetical protein
MSASRSDWVVCPHCGERIRRDAGSCRHCGSDERTGWSDDTYLDGIDLPDDHDYDEGLAREGFRRPRRGPRALIMGAVASLLVLLFFLWLLRGIL